MSDLFNLRTEEKARHKILGRWFIQKDEKTVPPDLGFRAAPENVCFGFLPRLHVSHC